MCSNIKDICKIRVRFNYWFRNTTYDQIHICIIAKVGDKIKLNSAYIYSYVQHHLNIEYEFLHWHSDTKHNIYY